jgi:hypothetical protein
VFTGSKKRKRAEPKASRFKGSSLVEMAKARGDLSSILDGFHLNAMESSLEQSTLSSQRFAVKSWTRFMDCMGLGDPLMIGLQLQVIESIVMRYLSFEIRLRGMSPRSINKTYLGGIASHFVRIGARNLFQDAVASKTVKYVKRGNEENSCVDASGRWFKEDSFHSRTYPSRE